MPVGFPSDDCEVPYRKGNALRKSLTQVALVV